MSASLSHGLPWLAAAGNRIVDSGSRMPVTLRGLNRSGLEYSCSGGGFLSAAFITEEEIREIVQEWGANIIRLPFNQDWALNGREGLSAETYLGALDQVIDWAASFGAYTLLDLQCLDVDRPFGNTSGAMAGPNFVAPLPDRDTVDLWVLLAQRYREEPAVLFDLLNEPHNRLRDDERPLCLIGDDGEFFDSDTDVVGPAQWLPWARRLIHVIRAEHERSLIWVSGLNWAFDHRGIDVNAPNIVHSAHVYPNRFRFLWESRFGFVGTDRPLFISEFGGGDDDLRWGSRLFSYINNCACGWTAWSWSDYPRLVMNAQAGDRAPTMFGDFVRNELRR